MARSGSERILNSAEEYEAALREVARLRDAGATAEGCERLAALEGAIARYVAKPGEPARRKARPSEGGADST